ncbi:MAG: glycosyltransferase family protein [Pseudanabaenaceae cyanobacterium]
MSPPSRPLIGVVLYGNPDYYPPTINAVHLLAEVYDVVVAANDCDPPHWPYPANVAVYRLGPYMAVADVYTQSVLAKLWRFGRFVAMLARVLRQVSLVYAYDDFGFVAAWLSLRLMGRTVPVIYHNHDLTLADTGWSLSAWVRRRRSQFVPGAAAIVFPEKDRARVFQAAIPALGDCAPILICPNFPRLTFYELPDDFAPALPDRFARQACLLQGTLSQTSSVPQILAAIAPSQTLILAGPIADEATQQALAAAPPHVLYLGRLPYAHLKERTWQATLGLCLYQIQADPNSQYHASACNKIFEYAACGLPVVVSDGPNYREFLGQEPWVRFADPTDPQAIATAIAEILQDLETYRTMALAARQAFETKFNYEIAFEPVFQRLRSLINPDNGLPLS